MSDIFISYKREEQPLARKLADALQKKGWSVWWDPKLRAGEHFDDAIERALNDAKCVIVMWSKLSVKSRYVKDEANYALTRNKLVPIAIEKVDLSFRFEGIQTGQLIDWDGSDNSAEFQKLVDDIAKIIATPPAEAEKHKRKQEEEINHREEERRRAEEKEKRSLAEEEAERQADEDALLEISQSAAAWLKEIMGQRRSQEEYDAARILVSAGVLVAALSVLDNAIRLTFN